MDSNSTVRETTNNAAGTVREDDAQKTLRESASVYYEPACIDLQTFRDYSVVEQLYR